MFLEYNITVSIFVFIISSFSFLIIGHQIKQEMGTLCELYCKNFKKSWYERLHALIGFIVLCSLPIVRVVVLYYFLFKLDYMKNKTKQDIYKELESLECDCK